MRHLRSFVDTYLRYGELVICCWQNFAEHYYMIIKLYMGIQYSYMYESDNSAT